MRLSLASLAERAGRGVRVTVIDSGVHANHPHVQGVAGGIGFDAAGDAHTDYLDRLGHGTAVTAVIREKAPAAEVFAIKVFDRELATTAAALVAALEWSTAQGARLVNLSLGTTNANHEPALRDAIRSASVAGTWVVSASPVEDARWLPGALTDVIAVEAEMSMPRDDCEVTVAPDGTTRVRASGYPRPIPGVSPEKNLKGVSFAVANATGLLARLLETVPVGTSMAAALGTAFSSTSPSR